MIHNTTLKYIATLKTAFNDICVYHRDDRGRLIAKSIPLSYGHSEKPLIASDYESPQFSKGNTHLIPRGFLDLVVISKDTTRITNKNRITITDSKNKKDYFFYNSLPYEFIFTLNIRCRGAIEAYQIVEQVAPLFNPVLNLDCWDSLYKDAPTRIPVTLDGVTVTQPEIDESSHNIYSIEFSMTLQGWIYQPVMTGDIVKNTITNFALNNESKNYLSILNDMRMVNVPRKLEIIDISRSKDPTTDTEILTAVTDVDDLLVIDYEWNIINGELLDFKGDKARMKAEEDFKVELKIKDQFGNFMSMTKSFPKMRYV